jgi:hypothetical protein
MSENNQDENPGAEPEHSKVIRDALIHAIVGRVIGAFITGLFLLGAYLGWPIFRKATEATRQVSSAVAPSSSQAPSVEAPKLIRKT